jgi:SAM-dependent methyltransferase
MAIDTSARQTTTTIDEEKLNAFMGKVVGDFGASVSAALVVLGDKLGLYKAMADSQPVTPAELAARTGTVERYVREWLINQAAGGYVEYDPATERFTLPPEQAVALADEESPFFVAGGFQILGAMVKAQPRILEHFRNGGGMLWGEHDADLFEGTRRFFRPGYLGNLVQTWIPALDGVQPKLERGALVADVGCGHGASTIIMAKAFPRSRFIGFDNHAPSVEAARQAAAEAGVADRVSFEVAGASEIPGTCYDLVAFFDCVHDMGDPQGALRRAREIVAADGTIMIVEPMAGERVEDNLNPIGRTFSGASTLCCTSNSLALGGPALGTIATEARFREIAHGAGLTRFRRATETPFNRVFEARP